SYRAAAWYTVSTPSNAFSTDARSVTSPSAYSTGRSAIRRRSLVGRTSTRTASPRPHSAAAVLLPRKPLAPVTREVIGINSVRSVGDRARMGRMSSAQELTEAVRGDTVPKAFVRTARRLRDRTALRWRMGDGGWLEITWAAYADRAARMAGALGALGIERGDRVVPMMRNRPVF